MRFTKTKLAVAFTLAAAVAAPSAFATNGMNMQGYGPIAYGMGGASMAYDNGAAAVMNNPATLAMMGSGSSRFDIALGYLSPNVDASAGGGAVEAHSYGGPYLMPAVGYIRKDGKFAYGLGVFAQGGMGTDYSAESFLALGSGDTVRSELGVGRFILPIAFSATENLTLGASLDYVWATLDLKMALTGAQLGGLVTGCSGPACPGLPGLGGLPWVRLDFSGGGDFNGAAKATGYAGKLGATYRFSPALAFGLAWHSKTSLDDMETDDTGASLSGAGVGTLGTGKIFVRDFQWPETWAAGLAWNASKDMMVAFDVKYIKWADVMKDFKLTYEGPVLGAPGNTIDFALPQNWKDEPVYQLGFAYKASDPLTVRWGINVGGTTIPDDYVNPLFPAIMKDHYTFGLGYAFSKTSELNLGFAYAPQNCATAASGVQSCTGGQSGQVMYSAKF
jgi:long-chain fatty acid transport protein